MSRIARLRTVGRMRRRLRSLDRELDQVTQQAYGLLLYVRELHGMHTDRSAAVSSRTNSLQPA